MGSTTAQDVAEACEERVFRQFGASSKLRHDQDPRFMSEVFSRFRDLLGMYADVEVFVKECTDWASAKGRPLNPGPSPGNIEPSRPFEVVSMDFVTHLPKSERGNTFLLLFQDAFSGYVMCM
ncbi:unnamed protein product [Phytophthora fragariaefolia]|uniref:Unnamed protein product n=1 Tax=Phytophthora fragariaefolia TaxID=1490495 RepID=A0A9W7DBT3_9STRA|nr:unnamed protein product [Phytophthora fragariaefolia]